MSNPKLTSEKHWYALYTKPRHEFKAQVQLEAKEIEFYLYNSVFEITTECINGKMLSM